MPQFWYLRDGEAKLAELLDVFISCLCAVVCDVVDSFTLNINERGHTYKMVTIFTDLFASRTLSSRVEYELLNTRVRVESRVAGREVKSQVIYI